MPTIASIAAGDSSFEILVAAIGFVDAEKGTDYLGTVSDPDQTLTLFAPTNAAFAQLASDLGFEGDTSDNGAVTTFLTTLGADTLETVILYHLAGEVLTAADVTAAGTVTTLQGGEIDASELPTLGDMEPDLINPSLTATDIMADNGVIHVIDRVLLPVDFEGNDAASITDTVIALSGEGFDDNGADFDMLREAVIAADLAGTLADPDADLTVFAPNDAAFIGLAQTLGYGGSDEEGAFGYIVDALRLLNGGGDPIDLLTTVLTYHVTGQSLQASQVLSATGEVETLAGGGLTVDADMLTVGDADPDIDDPMIIGTDVQASNGIVHVLDGVLLPADVLQSDGGMDVDFVVGSNDTDVVMTQWDADYVSGKGGNDIIYTGAGNDVVVGGDGRDDIFGGSGDDTLWGDAGNDLIKGGFGDDIIAGGAGNDVLFGGKGMDTFVVGMGDGSDTILGFRIGEDKIDLSDFGIASFDDLTSMVSGSGRVTEIDLADGTMLTIIGAKPGNWTADDFIL